MEKRDIGDREEGDEGGLQDETKFLEFLLLLLLLFSYLICRKISSDVKLWLHIRCLSFLMLVNGCHY